MLAAKRGPYKKEVCRIRRLAFIMIIIFSTVPAAVAKDVSSTRYLSDNYASLIGDAVGCLAYEQANYALETCEPVTTVITATINKCYSEISKLKAAIAAKEGDDFSYARVANFLNEQSSSMTYEIIDARIKAHICAAH